MLQSTTRTEKQVLGFEEALVKIAELREIEASHDYINPVGKTLVFAHPQKQAQAAVLFHGYTNCPKQFELLGKQLFEQGYNVYIPRLRYHGHVSRTSKAMKRLKQQDLIDYATESIELAQALGEEVIAIGLSGGGTIATWAGVHFQLKKIIAMAPIIDIGYYPKGLRYVIVKAMDILPNVFRWWDMEMKDKLDSPSHAYVWFSTKAISAFLHLAMQVEKFISHAQPQTPEFVFILNEIDKAATLERLNKFLTKLQRTTSKVKISMFEAKDHIHHDMIDPLQPGQKIDIVYPHILEVLNS